MVRVLIAALLAAFVSLVVAPAAAEVTPEQAIAQVLDQLSPSSPRATKLVTTAIAVAAEQRPNSKYLFLRGTGHFHPYPQAGSISGQEGYYQMKFAGYMPAVFSISAGGEQEMLAVFVVTANYFPSGDVWLSAEFSWAAEDTSPRSIAQFESWARNFGTDRRPKLP
jgi:hypothetical protein